MKGVFILGFCQSTHGDSAIFLLIAGTFTPACAMLMDGFHRRATLGVIWVTALAGIAVTLFFETWIPFPWNLALYLALGWCGALSARIPLRHYSLSVFEPLLLGGAAYTAGSAFLLAGRPVLIPGVLGPHELFHVAVLVGVGFHWQFVLQLAHGRLPVAISLAPEFPLTPPTDP